MSMNFLDDKPQHGQHNIQRDEYNPQHDEHTLQRVIALLECWADWRGTVRHVLLAHMQARCALHHVVKAQRQRGELWEHNRAPEPIDDATMEVLDTVLQSLTAPLKQAVRVTYVDGRNWSADRRAHHLNISRSAYYRRLSKAYAMIDQGIEQTIGWRNVVISG